MPVERKHIEAILAAWVNFTLPGAGSKDDEHRVDHALSIALAACDESPWRSMDSAPKDDTEVLLYFGDGRIEKAVWWDCYGEWVDTREYITMRNPTHWMPLPAAPEIARAGKGENA